MNFFKTVINAIIDGGMFVAEYLKHPDVEVGIPSNATVAECIYTNASFKEKKVKAMVYGGVLLQKKEDQPNADIEIARMVYVFYNDHTWTTFFVFADATMKEMLPPDYNDEPRVRHTR